MAAAVLALSLGETALAKGMKRSNQPGDGAWWARVGAVLADPWIVSGSALMAVHLGLYLLALRQADLSFALPLTAAAYPLSALLARFYLHENVGYARWAGTLIVTLGVAVVVLGEAVPDH